MRRKLSDKYYTFEEARAKLGMTKPRFQYWVKSGKIEKITPPKSKQGVYRKEEIDQLEKEIQAFFIADEASGLKFTKATGEDAREEIELSEFIFGKALHDISTHQQWLKKNPDIDFVLRENERLVGYINMYPMKPKAIEQFMSGRVRGWELSIDDLLPYTPNSQVECIIMDIATTQEAPKQQRIQFGARLIGGLIDFIFDLMKQQIVITKFHAIGSTPTGIAILKHADFQEIWHKDKRVAFELDTMRSNSLLAQSYRRVLDLSSNAQQT